VVEFNQEPIFTPFTRNRPTAMKLHAPRPRGFTLIELLVVMTIIAVLAGGIFGAAQMAIEKTRKLQGQKTAVDLANAINKFRDEYSRWPYASDSKEEKNVSNAAFLDNLIGKDDTRNKKSINFTEGFPLAKGSPPIGGLAWKGDQAELFDPWENYYQIYIDHDGDGEVTNPEGGDPLRGKLFVISPGKDQTLSGQNEEGKDATKDNVRSW
jgi:prepilin-type N-terminal cleavage/methylation domain-containing protein